MRLLVLIMLVTLSGCWESPEMLLDPQSGVWLLEDGSYRYGQIAVRVSRITETPYGEGWYSYVIDDTSLGADDGSDVFISALRPNLHAVARANIGCGAAHLAGDGKVNGDECSWTYYLLQEGSGRYELYHPACHDLAVKKVIAELGREDCVFGADDDLVGALIKFKDAGIEPGRVYEKVTVATNLASAAQSLESSKASCAVGTDPQQPGSDYPGGLSSAGGGLTPQELAGAITVSAAEAQCLLDSYSGDMRVLAAIPDRQKIPGAWVMPGAATGVEAEEIQKGFEAELRRVTRNDKTMPLITYCHHHECFLSYNVALRAIRAGYSNVFWLRDGIKGWTDAGYALEPIMPEYMQAVYDDTARAEVFQLGRLAEIGDPEAQIRLGGIFSKAIDLGTLMDLEGAAEWYERAASTGNVYAQHRAADTHLRLSHFNEARRWLTQASGQNDSTATMLLASLYEESEDSDPGADRGQAEWYYVVALRQGREDAIDELSSLFYYDFFRQFIWEYIGAEVFEGELKRNSAEQRDRLSRSLSFEQLDEARKLAAACLASGFASSECFRKDSEPYVDGF